MSRPRPGVLALQGSSEPHLERFVDLSLDPVEVRRERHLDGITHLVIPGGESTTIWHLMQLFGLWHEVPARFRAGAFALMGTCAGAILLGQEDGQRPPRLALLDARCTRNAYGRQRESFSREIELDGIPGGGFHAVFIRAPRFASVGAGVRVIARDGDDPVLVEAPGVMAATFHPELTPDARIHERFLRMTSRAVATPATAGTES